MALNWASASSRQGAICPQRVSESLASRWFMAAASCSRRRRRSSLRTVLIARLRAVSWSQPVSERRSCNFAECCANARNTRCVTSSARFVSRTTRRAVEWTRSIWRCTNSPNEDSQRFRTYARMRIWSVSSAIHTSYTAKAKIGRR